MSGMTFDQLAEYQKGLQAADDAQQQATGQKTVRKGGGYTSAPVNGNSVKLEKPIHDDLSYYTPGTVRNIKEGTSGADEYLLGDNAYAQIQALKEEWARANAAGDDAAAQQAHEQAEAIRARAGYSGGADGGGYTVVQRPRAQAEMRYPVTAPGAGVATKPGTATGTQGSSDLTSLLEEWKKSAAEQANGQIDYAVSQAITELERALADSQSQYKEQAESVAKEERQALDNSALYAEARGDKGGIGQSQYNEIQAAAAQNRLAVQQAQTRLSTDTARQIADLRAQGEFEKADKLLEITQQYLSQLVSLEQWAAEFGLSQQQFQESVRQWEAEFALATRQYNDGLTADRNGQYADMGSALLSAGIMPSGDQLTAMGMTESQAREYLMQLQLESAAKQTQGGGEPVLTWPQTLAQIEKGNLTANVLSAYRYYMGEEYQKAEPTAEPVTLSEDGKAVQRVISDPMFRAPATAAAYIEEQLNAKKITEAEAGYLLSLVGY